LITQILSEDIDCKCIIEPTTNTTLLKTKADEMPEYDFKSDLFNALKIDNEKTLDSLIKLSDNFKLTKSMFSSEIKLIDRKEFDKTTTRKGQEERIALQKKCPCKYFLSKPIFDKKFKVAVVSIGMNCGPLCGHGGYYIYRLKNGVWESDNGFAFWIS
jgi:hypothetical protein